MSCCRAASSLIALYFKRSRVRCLTIPVPVKCLSRNDARQLLRGRWRRGNRQLKLLQRTKIVGGLLKSAPSDSTPLNSQWTRRYVPISLSLYFSSFSPSSYYSRWPIVLLFLLLALVWSYYYTSVTVTASSFFMGRSRVSSNAGSCAA